MTSKKTPQTTRKTPSGGSKRPIRSATSPTDSGKTPDTTPLPRIRLRTLEDVSRELRLVYRMARHGRIEPSVSTKLTFILNVLAGLVEATTIEHRIRLLEGKINEIETRKPSLRSVG